MAIRTYKTYTQSFSGDAPTLSDYNSFLEKISTDITSSKCGVLLIERIKYDSEEFNHYPYHAQSKLDSTNELYAGSSYVSGCGKSVSDIFVFGFSDEKWCIGLNILKNNTGTFIQMLPIIPLKICNVIKTNWASLGANKTTPFLTQSLFDCLGATATATDQTAAYNRCIRQLTISGGAISINTIYTNGVKSLFLTFETSQSQVSYDFGFNRNSLYIRMPPNGSNYLCFCPLTQEIFPYVTQSDLSSYKYRSDLAIATYNSYINNFMLVYTWSQANLNYTGSNAVQGAYNNCMFFNFASRLYADAVNSGGSYSYLRVANPQKQTYKLAFFAPLLIANNVALLPLCDAHSATLINGYLALINSSTNDTFQSGHIYNISNNYYMSLYTGNHTVLVEV